MTILAIGEITIANIDDINISTDQPIDPVPDQLWLDTSTVPNVLKRWGWIEDEERWGWLNASPTSPEDIGAEEEGAAAGALVDAKNSIAYELGYTNFADMVTKAQIHGKTIIEGGYLNTDLIDAGSIVAGHIAAGTITTGHINMLGLDAGVIKTGQLDAERINVQIGGRNLIPDSKIPRVIHEVEAVQVVDTQAEWESGTLTDLVATDGKLKMSVPVQVFVSADTYCRQEYPTTNYGDIAQMFVLGSSGYYSRAYIKFDVSDLDVDKIERVELFAYCYFNDTPEREQRHHIKRITEGWSEDSLTYNDAPSFNGEGTLTGGSYGRLENVDGHGTGVNKWRKADITNLVLEWLNGTYTNYGLVLDHSYHQIYDGGTWARMGYRTKEYDDGSLAPYLKITYKEDAGFTGIWIGPPLSLDAITDAADSLHLRSATAPAGTTVKYYVAITSSGVTTPSSWTEQVSAGAVTGIVLGNNYTGKWLWFRIVMSTADATIRAEVDSFSIEVTGKVHKIQRTIQLDAGQLYTFQSWSSGNKVATSIYEPTMTYPKLTNILPNNITPFTPEWTGEYTVEFYAEDDPSDVMAKLERGNIPTDWTPAPEDGDLSRLANGNYPGGTFIDGTTIISPTVVGLQGTFAELTAGNPTGARLELGESAGAPFLDMYDEEELRVKLEKDRISFYSETDRYGGSIQAKPLDYFDRNPQLVIDAPWEGKIRLFAEYTGPAVVDYAYIDVINQKDGCAPYISLYALQASAGFAQSGLGIWPEGVIYSNAPTTVSTANCRIGTDPSMFYRSTSAEKYKSSIEPIDYNRAEAFFERCQPSWYRSLCRDDRKDWSWYGYVADEVAKVEPRLVDFNKDGEPEGFAYDHVAPLLHVVIRNNRKMIEGIEERLAAIENILIKDK